LLVLLHGNVLTIFDLMDKSKKFQHVRLMPLAPGSQDFYNLDDEAVAIWMMDKDAQNASKRW